MGRELKAPLSPNELNTLERMDQGANPEKLRKNDLFRLHQLGLVSSPQYRMW